LEKYGIENEQSI
jgi:hypothetical protein